MNQNQHPPLKDFPPLIGRALARISGCDGAGLSELNYQGRMLLARIVRNVCVRKPQESVRVSNNCLAIGLGISDRTVRRIKADLEEAGWITRHQKQSRRHGMQVSDIWLTPVALHTLGLVSDSAATCVPTEKSQVTNTTTQVQLSTVAVDEIVRPTSIEQSQTVGVKHHTPVKNAQCEKNSFTLDVEKLSSADGSFQASASAILADACCIPLNIQSSTKSHPSGGFELSTGSAAEVKISEVLPADLNKKKTFGAPSALPEDVAVLETKGLTRFAVFKLMGIATRKGKRLGQIVTAMGEGLFKARNLFSYLNKLIDVERDWSTYKAPIVVRREEQEQKRAEFENRAANRTFVLEQFSKVFGFLNLTGTKLFYLVNEAIYSRDVVTGQELGRVVAFDQVADALRSGKLIPK